MIEKKINSTLLFKSSFIYTVGEFLRRGVNFLLLPLYTSILAATGYGALAMLSVYGNIFVLIINFGLVTAFTVKYKEYKEKQQETVLINSIITFLIIAGIFILFVLNITLPWYASGLIKTEGSLLLLRLYLVISICNVLLNFYFGVLRIRFQNMKHLILSLFNFFLTTVLIVYLLLVVKMKVLGVILGLMVPLIIMLVYFFIDIKFRFQFNWDIFKPILKFGIWMVPANLAIYVYSFADRIFIQEYFSIKEVGIYSLGAKLAMLLTVFFIKPFRRSYGPYIYQKETDGFEHGINLSLKYLLIVCGIGFLGISLASSSIIRFMATSEFVGAISVVPILLICQIGDGASHIFAAGIFKSGKSFIYTIIVFAGAVLNIFLNFFLVPRYNIIGAAFATLITYTVLVFMIYYFSVKENRFKLNFVFIKKYIFAMALLYLEGSYLIKNIESYYVKIFVYLINIAILSVFFYFILEKSEQNRLKDNFLKIRQKVKLPIRRS